MSADADALLPSDAPVLERLDRILFGLDPAAARRALEGLRSEDRVAYDAWRRELWAREESLRALASRRDVTLSVLESTRATAVVLATQVERARANAEHVEAASAAETEEEIERLAAMHAARVQEAQHMLVASAQRRLELERALSVAMGRIEAAAHDLIDGPGAEAEPAGDPDQGFAHLAAVLTGDPQVAVPPAAPADAAGLARVPFAAFGVAVQTRAGATVGHLAALLVRERGGRVVGYELGVDGDGVRWVPAADVLALRQGVVVVRGGYQALEPGAALDAVEGAPLRVVDRRRLPGRRAEDRPGAADGPAWALPAPDPVAAASAAAPHAPPPDAPADARPNDAAAPAEAVGEAEEAALPAPLASTDDGVAIALAPGEPPLAAPEPPPPPWARAESVGGEADWMAPASAAAAPSPLPPAAAMGSALGSTPSPWVGDAGALPAPWAGDAPSPAGEAPTAPSREAAAAALAPPWASAPERGERPGDAAGTSVAPDVLAFLAGKVVGQDILGADGEVIARRGERIDAALADRVERAGRLPELIVYMTLDDG